MEKRDIFPTIDDAFLRVEEGYFLLKKLKDFKYPLTIRRGVKREEHTQITASEKGRTLKARGRTYFFDIKETHDETRYILITESRLKGGKPYQGRVAIFPEDAQAFLETLQEMVGLVLGR